MRKSARFLAAALIGVTITTPAAAAPAAADAQFAALSQRFIDALARFNPVAATELGDHRYDDRLPDISPAGRAARDAEWRAILSQLAAIDRASLSRDNQVDQALLTNELRYRLWQDERLQDWAWDPLVPNEYAANALYLLAARDFAPWPDRLRDSTARMEALPAFFAQMRAGLVAARVPKVFAETLSKRNQGLIDSVEQGLVPHLDALDATDRERFDRAYAALKRAVAEQQTWIDTVLVPGAKGDFRLGPTLYDKKMRFALQSSLSREELKAHAAAEFAAVRAQMYALSQDVLKGRPGARSLPNQPSPAEQQAAISAALALSYAQQPARDKLMDAARAALAHATEFVRVKRLVGLPDSPVTVIEMPRSRWGYAVAYDDPPGALDKDQPNFFAVAPIPPEWTDEQAHSFLSEYNDFMIHDLAIHEAMPGHYLQLAHANHDPDVLRAVLQSGPFIEGWAVYGEGMMADEGYLNRDPLYRLTVLKMRLRSVTNTLLDIGIHAEGMTEARAMDLMMNGAFQTEREAAGKWTRASLSSVQLLSYFTGYEEHMALREEAKERWGKDYSLRRYNDAVLAHGSPPVKYVRALMFGLPVQ